MVHQLVKDLPCDDADIAGFEKYYVDHTLGVWPQAAGGVPFTATEFQSSGDPIADLFENMAAEQKARKTYDNILSLVKDITSTSSTFKSVSSFTSLIPASSKLSSNSTFPPGIVHVPSKCNSESALSESGWI